MRLLLAAAAFSFLALLAPPLTVTVRAQEAPTVAPAADRVAVYLDCRGGCDSDFIRTEIGWVDWVRDRAAADVHILVTDEQTGGGGSRYTLAFLGLRAFAALGDTLVWEAPQSSTPDNVRRGLKRTIAVGLVPYVARTTAADRLAVTVSAPAAAAATAAPTRDPWNRWVFGIGFNTNINGERTQTFSSIGGNLSARRTTEQWKVSLTARQNYRQSDFEIGGRKSTFINRTYSFNPLVVRSLGPRLSAGMRGAVGSSTFENKRLYWRVTPAVEYDIFPYAESTRRLFTLQYGIGAEGFEYNEETIYFKREETRPVHTLSLTLNQNQPWGNVNVGAEGGQYLDATYRNFGVIYGGTSLRLFKGFNFNVNGSFSSIHNQLYIPRRGATPEEVLLQQRRLETNYSYYVFTGISYTFGSVFNPVVNPRFGRGDGGGSSCFCF